MGIECKLQGKDMVAILSTQALKGSLQGEVGAEGCTFNPCSGPWLVSCVHCPPLVSKTVLPRILMMAKWASITGPRVPAKAPRQNIKILFLEEINDLMNFVIKDPVGPVHHFIYFMS